jgi:hypothetical protein
LQGDEATSKSYVDASSFVPWTKAAIGAVSFKKILQGYGDRTFRPQASITRAELVVTLDRALKVIALQDPTETQVVKNTYSAAGTYGPVSGTVRIVLEGSTTLEQGTIKSPVILELGQDSKTGSLIIDALLKAMEGSGVPVSSHNDGNSNQPTASITVTNAALITDISVDNGVSLLAVLGQLPTTVQITLSDLTTPTVNLSWDGGSPDYNGSIAETYVFTGTPELPMTISNPNDVKATVKVIVAAAPPAQRFLDAALAAINLDVAAAISSGLPATFPL